MIVELVGAEEAPGAKEGGVLEQVTREVDIEALPTDIPDVIRHDVSEMVIGDTITVEALVAPSGVTVLTDSEAVIATLNPPRLQTEAEEGIEEETGLVGEGERWRGGRGGRRRRGLSRGRRRGESGGERRPPCAWHAPGRLADRRSRKPGDRSTRGPATTSGSKSPAR